MYIQKSSTRILRKTIKRYCLMVFMILPFISHAQENSFEIVEQVWTDSVDSNGLFTNRLSGNIHRENIILWLKIRIGKSWMDTINHHEKLPLKFKWFQSAGGATSSKFISDPSDLFTSKKLNFDSLKIHAPSNFKIDWIIWSQNIDVLETGKWTVKVVKPIHTIVREYQFRIN